MDNIIENSLNFWQQRLNNSSQARIMSKKKQRSIVDRVVIESAEYWRKIADEFQSISSTNKSVQSQQSQPHNQQISDC